MYEWERNCFIYTECRSLCFRDVAGPLFTKRTNLLPQDRVTSRSRAIGCHDYRIALKFDRHLGSPRAEVPVKIQSDWKGVNPNLAASRLHGILR